MALKDDLAAQVKTMFADQWTTRDGRVVPEPSDLKLSNDAIMLSRATVLYADLSGSTRMVDSKKWWFAAEVYKAFLHCAATVMKAEGGIITSYDGDRVMGVFIGDLQTTSAARCGLKINYAVEKIINPALKARYSKTDMVVRQVVGIDTSPIHAARTGVRGDNDIVWVGRAANHAAKLTEINGEARTWLTKAAYDKLDASARMGGNPETNMWKRYRWDQHDDSDIYGSTWRWAI